MNTTTLHLHTAFVVDTVDPRVFGGFLEHLGRAVYEGVYEPSSPHADDMGCRKDVLDALRRLDFTAMRYPGGNYVSGFHWLDSVGPRENRPRVRDLAWHSIETNEFGPDEFIDLARRMGWTPMLAVNLGTGTPEEAKNWLEYCNVRAGTKWSDMRVANGYAEPHNVKLWCLGNEMDGPWQIGHMPAEQYAILANQTARLMKMCDPSIELVACGSCGTELPSYMDWDRKVLEFMEGDVDFLSVHSYVGNWADDTPEFLATIAGVEQQIEAANSVCVAAQHKKRSKKRTYLSYDEWNVWYRARTGIHVDGKDKFAPPLLEEVYNLEDALVVASYLNAFIRNADCIKIANIAQIVNVIAPIMTRGDQMILQTIFHPFEMISKRREGTSLRVVVDSPRYTTKKHGDVNLIDASAILNHDELKVFLVNRDLNATMDVRICVGDRSVDTLLSAEIVSGTDPKAVNDFEHPNRVHKCVYEDLVIRDGVAIVSLPPLSIFAGTMKLV